ncbi:MAG TPA: WecB/TagA/CpsF family glycosyltransferase, partial [Caulobacteraceae bacterium]
AFRPDVLMVGMGMPRQELWILDHFEALPDCVILPVGAAFDYEAGVQAAAPRWMGRLGLEWLFRLAHDPKRLFVRYCVEPWTLVGPALGDLRRARRRP